MEVMDRWITAPNKGGQGANCQQIGTIDRCVAINTAIIAIITDLTVQSWSTVKYGEGDHTIWLIC